MNDCRAFVDMRVDGWAESRWIPEVEAYGLELSTKIPPKFEFGGLTRASITSVLKIQL